MPIEDITHWAGYAPDYFKEKWGLDDDLAKWRSRLEATKEHEMTDPIVEEEEAAGADGEALGQMLGELFNGITTVLKSQEAIREVQNVLLLRLGEAVLNLQITAGHADGAKKLGDAFGMAAAVLDAHHANREEEE